MGTIRYLTLGVILVAAGCGSAATGDDDDFSVDGGADLVDGGNRNDGGNDLADASSTGGDPDAAVCEGSMSDPDNCGVCGHSCLDMPCDMGVCRIKRVTPVLDAVDSYVTDDNFLFWSTPGPSSYLVYRGSASGSGSPVQFGVSGDPIIQIAMDATKIYYRSPGVSMPKIEWQSKSSLTGGTVVQYTSAVGGLITEGGYVYYGSSDKNIHRVISDGGDDELFVFANEGDATMVISDATSFFWTDGTNVEAVDKTGSNLRGFGSSEAVTIAVGDTDVYWLDTSGNLRARAKSGTGPTPVIETSITGVAHDGTYRYDGRNGHIRVYDGDVYIADAVLLPDGGMDSVCTRHRIARDLTVVGNHVYFVVDTVRDCSGEVVESWVGRTPRF